MAFPDVPDDHWAAEDIELVTKHHIIYGYDDGTFRPEDELERDEVAAIFARHLRQHHGIK